MNKSFHILLLFALGLGGCTKKAENAAEPGGRRKIVIGFLAKSLTNDVFQAAQSGALAAAKELGEKYNADVQIEIRTPNDEDATKQAEAIEALTRRGVDGIAVSCSEANTVTPSIDKAVEKGIPVMCFDSDAPNSKRFAFYGSDAHECGARIMEELARAMGEKGTVAILGGNQSAPNLQRRVAGAKEALTKFPNMKLNEPGVFYHAETPEKGAEAVQTAQNANPRIQGWCMIGGWPLFTADALKWPPGSIKVVAADALPAQLVYVKSGYVDALFAQDCYGWGTKSVQVLLDKIVNKQDPPSPNIVDSLTKVTKENVDEFGHNWEKWLGEKVTMPGSLIEFRSITKTFGGVTALRDVSLEVERAECHGLMGENGAGKSTLGKVLAGIHQPDLGAIYLDGTRQSFSSPRDAHAAGIAMVHQELAFCSDLSVAENLCMGHYPRKLGLLLDREEMARRADSLLRAIGVHLDVWRPMRDLSTAQEQLVQIAAAIGTDPKILIFDEPTSSLSEPDAQALFQLIEDLKKRGITIIYVSHRMPELFRLCDKISVLRDGQYVGTLARAEMTPDKVVRMMVGHSVPEFSSRQTSGGKGEILLRVRRLSSPGRFRDLSFEVRAGEIVGFAGLVGAGRSEMAKAIFGLDRGASGEIELAGRRLDPGSVKAAMQAGVALVPEDRKRQGCVLGMPCRANVSMAMLDRLRHAGLLDRKKEKEIAFEYFQQLQVKAASVEAPVYSLSGGNQQKIVLAKWLARGGKLLIVDEPTRGVDVGAKAAIHALIDQLAGTGLAVILISSELPEILSLSHRILVMREGEIVGELARREATQESVLRLMAGVARAA